MCTCANEFDCEEVFERQHDASSHAILNDVPALHKPKKKQKMGKLRAKKKSKTRHRMCTSLKDSGSKCQV